jgi:hypothetical protein
MQGTHQLAKTFTRCGAPTARSRELKAGFASKAGPRSKAGTGVPESFIVDGKGIIRYQHIGPIEAGDIPTILAKLETVR